MEILLVRNIIHSYNYGPANVKASHAASYFLTLIDGYLCYSYVYLLSHRLEALNHFKRFAAEVYSQIERKMIVFRTNLRCISLDIYVKKRNK